LQQVAVRVTNRLREVDTVARLGGDEFVILIEDVPDCQNVGLLAQMIIETLNQPFTLRENYQAHIGASIGIAMYPKHGDNLEALMDNADAALYHAKDNGRGCFAYFSAELAAKRA
jgi:diguanylate cyclase (GGDEF)-like protein